MAKKKKSSTPRVEEPKPAYPTKRVLLRAIAKGSKDLAANAFLTQGYTVIVKGGWVVKVDVRGKVIEGISKVKTTRPRKINLD